MNKRKQVRNIYNIVVICLLIAGVGYVCSRLFHFGSTEFTDNAQVYRHITPVNSRIQGYIREIRFEEYQYVHRGDTLMIIDDAEFRLRLAQAEADLASARSGRAVTVASVATQQSSTSVADASIDEARTQMEHAHREAERYETLLKKEAVTRQQYDAVATAYRSAEERYQRALRQKQTAVGSLGEQQTRLGVGDAGIRVAEAQVDLARLNLSYTVITAQCDGIMGRKAVHEGQLVQPGQTLAQIVDMGSVWVIANYRESQLPNIAEGASVEITADALPDLTFRGTVERMSGATGNAVSVVPQDNATGNFVKVEQRVPIRISLDSDNDAEAMAQLKAGMNVECKVEKAKK